MTSTGKIRVVIADDHELVRQGIRMLLERAPDIEVVGEAADGNEAVSMASRLEPDVLVLDLTMPGLSGIEATDLANRQTKAAVVVLTMHEDESLVRQAIAHGAKGYVLKGSVADELLLAVRAAYQGEIYLSRKASTNGATGPRGPELAEQAITRREREVLRLIGEGLTNKAIAARLGISVKTVERHRTSVMAKLDVHSVVDLVRAGIKLGLIKLS